MAKDPQTKKGKKPSDKQGVDPVTEKPVAEPVETAEAEAETVAHETAEEAPAEGGSEQAAVTAETTKEQEVDPVTGEPVAEPAETAEAEAETVANETAEEAPAEGGSDQAAVTAETTKEQEVDPVTEKPVAEPAETAEAEAETVAHETAEEAPAEGESEQAAVTAETTKKQEVDPVTGEPVAEPAETAEAETETVAHETAEEVRAEGESEQASPAESSDQTKEVADQPKTGGKEAAEQTGKSEESDVAASQDDEASRVLLGRAGLPDIDVVKGYLTRIYQATHGGEESFETILAEMPSTVLDYLEANSELLDQSMHAQSEDELKELFDVMSGNGPVITPGDIPVDVPLTDQSVAYLMRQWAWSSIEISDKIAREILGDLEVARLYSQAGVPMLIKAGNDKERPCVSFTMLGGKGYDEKLSNIEVLESDVEGDATGSLDGKIDIMRACVDMLVLAKSDKTVIQQGLHEAKRNLWALSKVFDKNTEGFEPTEEDEKWLSKRSRHLQEAFAADLQAAPTHAPTQQLGSGGQAKKDDEESK